MDIGRIDDRNKDDVLCFPYNEYDPFGTFSIDKEDGFSIGIADAWLQRDGTFSFTEGGSQIPYIDKSRELVSRLRKAQHKAVKEVGRGSPEILFHAIARCSGLKGKICGG